MKYKPRKKVLENVINWLSEQRLYVYGPAVDLKKGYIYPGNQDYTAEMVLEYIKKKEKLVEKEWE